MCWLTAWTTLDYGFWQVPLQLAMVRRITDKRRKSCVILMQVISMAAGRLDIGAINSGGHETRPYDGETLLHQLNEVIF
jgi:hypothetical protein